MKFTTIGFGRITQTKKGTKAITLSFYPNVKKSILDNDFQNKIWIFKNTSQDAKTPYTVMAPMPDDFVPEK